jgi:hypothetical protein
MPREIEKWKKIFLTVKDPEPGLYRVSLGTKPSCPGKSGESSEASSTRLHFFRGEIRRIHHERVYS